jgi:hypothetical protein
MWFYGSSAEEGGPRRDKEAGVFRPWRHKRLWWTVKPPPGPTPTYTPPYYTLYKKENVVPFNFRFNLISHTIH